jgi:phosphohistidine phosphatase
MKTLLLMRHAKSSWKDSDLPDHERPLNKRGKKDSIFMGEVLKEKELLPQTILASSAVRIRETIDGMTGSSDFAGEVEYSDELYLAEPDVFLKILKDLPDTIERVMVMGHNPGLEGLLQVLSGRIESLPTGSIAYLSLPIQQWSELSGDTEGELIEMLLPRELRELAKEKNKGKDKKDKKEDKKDSKKEDKKAEKKETDKEKKSEKKK